MSETIKKGIRSWLNIIPSSPYAIMINETLDFELNAIRNKIWYRGDGNELDQMYAQFNEYADKYKFWASKCSPGMEMRKIHTGLPRLIVQTLSSIVLADINDFEFESTEQENLWSEIEKDNKFKLVLERAVQDALVVGDGAFKISIDTQLSKYPIVEWYSGERVEFVRNRGRLREIIFKTPYRKDHREYILHEHYGFGYVSYHLYQEDREVDMSLLPETTMLQDCAFDKKLILATPLSFFASPKFDGRGGSLYDGKIDSFDSLDEAWSQWMDALRAGRARTYIPDSVLPRNPYTGEILKPNAFDNRYIKTDADMSEKAVNKVDVEQPSIPYDSYQASYSTALDLCLQGIISPSTLGIDVKKLDNSEAQREKEKATLYTRNKIIEALQDTLPDVLTACLSAYGILTGLNLGDIKVTVSFGEYANPSFESQVETISKAKTGGIMSIEALVDELYGETKDEEWKQEEIKRLKAEQGIVDMEEPSLNLEGVGIENEGQGDEPTVPNEPTGVSKLVKSSQ
ncbi:MAG: capsid protein [Lachnospiraceae bacterium]